MTWLTDEDRENQKRFTPKDDNIPEYTYLFRDNDDGSTFRKRMKNGQRNIIVHYCGWCRRTKWLKQIMK